jgi:hypothetical protein
MIQTTQNGSELAEHEGVLGHRRGLCVLNSAKIEFKSKSPSEEFGLGVLTRLQKDVPATTEGARTSEADWIGRSQAPATLALGDRQPQSVGDRGAQVSMRL